MLRRRARLSAAVIWPMVSRAAEAGSGALPSNSNASGASRSSNAASAAGKNSRSAWRSRSRCLVRSEDQRFVRPGDDLDRLRFNTVAGDRA
jgi:hypothetical protein